MPKDAVRPRHPRRRAYFELRLRAIGA